MAEDNYFKRTLLRIRWVAMSDRERYAYLWQQTRESMCNENRLHSRYAYLRKHVKDTPYDGHRLNSVR